MLSIAIQAGGESRRMGQNKALMPFAGKPLVQYLAARLAGAPGELFVTANQPELFGFLGLPVYPDAIPGRGTLGGLLTALRNARYPLLAAVACDMPFASLALLRHQSQLLLDDNLDLAVPATTLGLEPLHAVYRVAACLPVVEAAIASGKWKLTGWFERVKVHTLAVTEWESYDPDHVVFTNLNTPDDFLKAEQYAQGHST